MIAFLEKYRNIDMLHGSLWDKILIFSIPLAITSMLQQLFNTADIWTLGNFVGDEAVAAVGTNIPIVGLVVNLFVGVSLGANVVVARYLGMGDRENASVAVHTAFFLALLIGVMIALVGVPCVDLIMSAMGVPANVTEQAAGYLTIYFSGMPFIALYNFEAALFRSKGDTNNPLIALIAASVFNVIGNLVVVLVCGMGADGVALTTVLANGVAAAYLLFRLRRDTGFLHVEYRRVLRPQLRKARAIVSIGLPAGIQGMVFAMSNLLIQSAINYLGTATMAASGAAVTVEINVYCVVNAFGLAATTFISQNYGAGNLPRCRQIVHTCFWLDTVLTIVFGGLMLLFARRIMGLFFTDQEVITIAVIRMLFVIGPELLNVFMEIMSGTLRGFGYSLAPALMTLIGICSVRILWLYTVFPLNPTYPTLMTCYGLSWAVTSLLIFIIYVRHQRALFRREQKFKEFDA